MTLYSYKMTHDSGFAPNPFHGFLTLATCKPGIRRNTHIGDYVAGFTSVQLCGDLPGNEKLVFIMRVKEKLTFSEYWDDNRFILKKPPVIIPNGIRQINELSDIKRKLKFSGDNIYQPVEKALKNYLQIPNINHCSHNKETDLEGKYVLVSNDFYYFGRSAIKLPIKVNLPKCQSKYGSITENANELLDYLNKNFETQKNTCIGYPHSWGIF